MGEETLKRKFSHEEKIGITVSGGKDSIFIWDWAVRTFGPDRIIAFNHRKVGMVHPLAEENIERASKILQSKIIYIDENAFYPRFMKNLKAYIKNPNASILRAVLCAGCRYGISNTIFQECHKLAIKKVINGSAYLEAAPFKEYYMTKLGNGNETRGLLLGLLEEEEYLEKKDFYTQEMPINSVFTALFKGAWCLNLCDTVIRCSMKIVPNACTAEGAKVLFS